MTEYAGKQTKSIYGHKSTDAFTVEEIIRTYQALLIEQYSKPIDNLEFPQTELSLSFSTTAKRSSYDGFW